MAVTDAIPEDPAVAAVVRGWVDRAYRAFRADGRGDPEEELTTLTDTYDGREESVRARPTNLTDLIGDAMLDPLKSTPVGSRLAIFNGGSIRIDDELQPGPVTTYDVLRVLPFGGTVYAVELGGDVLAGMLDHTVSDNGQDPGRNTGAFIQTRNVTRTQDGKWLLGGTALDPKKTYTVVSNDYLIRGDQKLENTGAVVFKAQLEAVAKANNLTFDQWRALLSAPGQVAASGPRTVKALGDWRDLLGDHLRAMRSGPRPPAGGGTAPTQEVLVRITGPDSPPAAPGAGAGPADEKKGPAPDGKWSFEPFHVLLVGAVLILLVCAVGLLVLLPINRYFNALKLRRADLTPQQFLDRCWELLAAGQALAVVTRRRTRTPGWRSSSASSSTGSRCARRGTCYGRPGRPGRWRAGAPRRTVCSLNCTPFSRPGRRSPPRWPGGSSAWRRSWPGR
jgi:hypothetical protein